MYKTACLAFAGLAMLLITGAIWANESWGRPWGFDSKETGALIAWLTYAAFLHTRISRGWKGRSSAYFAVIGFLVGDLYVSRSELSVAGASQLRLGVLYRNTRYVEDRKFGGRSVLVYDRQNAPIYGKSRDFVHWAVDPCPVLKEDNKTDACHRVAVWASYRFPLRRPSNLRFDRVAFFDFRF